MTLRFQNATDNPTPGNAFRESYATVVEERDGELYFSTLKNLESLESYLSENAVDAVRINQEETPQSHLLDSFEEEYAVSSSTDEVRAILYGEEEKVIFGGEELQ